MVSNLTGIETGEKARAGRIIQYINPQEKRRR
jgi:hypothetical protein